MPGPCSTPWSRDQNGRKVVGKTAMRRLRLKSMKRKNWKDEFRG